MALSPEALEAKRAYQREWARKNKERIKQTRERYWERKAQELKEKNING